LNDAYENVVVRFKEGKAFLDYSTLVKMGEELIVLSPIRS
jgi:hypothetical protein